ncbi:unnamed protein product [Staurois parvus]|uniref:Uncharacterized protein n=1 Tax=Staurois parvus TaxID=386267 RepID=A0ABN9C6P4_9NEOB|nr:unnamed protein product [Staurois parvus]
MWRWKTHPPITAPASRLSCCHLCLKENLCCRDTAFSTHRAVVPMWTAEF